MMIQKRILYTLMESLVEAELHKRVRVNNLARKNILPLLFTSSKIGEVIGVFISFCFVGYVYIKICIYRYPIKPGI